MYFSTCMGCALGDVRLSRRSRPTGSGPAAGPDVATGPDAAATTTATATGSEPAAASAAAAAAGGGEGSRSSSCGGGSEPAARAGPDAALSVSELHILRPDRP